MKEHTAKVKAAAKRKAEELASKVRTAVLQKSAKATKEIIGRLSFSKEAMMKDHARMNKYAERVASGGKSWSDSIDQNEKKLGKLLTGTKPGR